MSWCSECLDSIKVTGKHLQAGWLWCLNRGIDVWVTTVRFGFRVHPTAVADLLNMRGGVVLTSAYLVDGANLACSSVVVDLTRGLKQVPRAFGRNNDE